MSSKGRPQVYTDEYLLEQLNKYVEDNPNVIVKYPALEKATGIPQHIWKYRMRPYVDKYNHNHKQGDIPSLDITKLPSADDMIRIANGNMSMLKVQIEMLLDLVMQAEKYKYAAATIEEMKIKHNNELEFYITKTKEQEQTIEKLENMLGTVMIDSQYPDKRDEQGIRNNIIPFNRMKDYEQMLKDFDF